VVDEDPWARPASPGEGAALGDAKRSALDVADARAIAMLTAEHASLVASRNLAYNEGFVRTGMFLTALSAALVALGFVAQAFAFKEGFAVFAVMVLVLVLTLGLTTLVRVAETTREDFRAVQGINRIRHAYFEICPGLVRYFSTADRDDFAGILATYDAPSDGTSMTRVSAIVHGLGTATGMVALMVSLVGGALAGLVAGLLGAPLLGTAAIGGLVFVAMMGAILFVVVRSLIAFGARLETRFPSQPDPGAEDEA